MLDSPSSSPGPPVADPPQTKHIVVFLLAVDGVVGDDTITSVRRQVYEAAAVAVIGGGDDGRSRAAALDLEHHETVAAGVEALDRSVDLVWFVHGDAVPRPDALGALVAELSRNDASMVGSKILRADDDAMLESVGASTDVFGEPYSGLDPDEVDLEQYDVVRDVSFVSGVSVLMRRDLLRGLRGIDRLLPPSSAGMDLSQRARLAGGRVMIVPSSETLHRGSCRHDVAGWRELAGRMRAMAKAYRLMTLAWVIPVGFLIGLFDGVMRLFLGQGRPLLDHLRATAWNAVHVVSTLTERRKLRSVRQSGDEELFRYQVAGSLVLRRLVSDFGERLGWVIDQEEGLVTEDEMARESSAAGPIVAGLMLVVLGLAARSLWIGSLPAVGFSLPVHPDSGSVLGSWAGGWNPAGLGSPDPTHPSVAIASAFDWLLGGWSASQAVFTALSMIVGTLFLGRIVRRLGVDGPSRHLAPLVLYLGAGGSVVAGATDWATFVAIGPSLLLLDTVIRPMPSGLRAVLGVVGGLLVSATLTSFLAPLATAAIAVAGLLAWPLAPGVRIGSPIRALLAAAFGALAVSPYLAWVEPRTLISGGPSFTFDPVDVRWLVVAAAAVLAILGGFGRRWRAVTWASLLAFAPPLVVEATGWGGDAAAALALIGAVGAGLVIGLVIPYERAVGRFTSLLRGLAVTAAMVAVAVSLGPVLDGRAGFPADEWNDRLEFGQTLSDEAGEPRTLVIGAPDQLPGESRSAELFSYRLLNGPPTLDQARLPEPLNGDDALAVALQQITTGGVVRPGELLAPFAIRWVVVFEGVPITENLDAQLDLVPVPVSEEAAVFDNVSYRPRAMTADGEIWEATRSAATGEPTDVTVRWAETASGRWVPGWSQVEWFNVLSGRDGEITYRSNTDAAALAWAAVVMLGLGSALWIWGRETS